MPSSCSRSESAVGQNRSVRIVICFEVVVSLPFSMRSGWLVLQSTVMEELFSSM